MTSDFLLVFEIITKWLLAVAENPPSYHALAKSATASRDRLGVGRGMRSMAEYITMESLHQLLSQILTMSQSPKIYLTASLGNVQQCHDSIFSRIRTMAGLH